MKRAQVTKYRRRHDPGTALRVERWRQRQIKLGLCIVCGRRAWKKPDGERARKCRKHLDGDLRRVARKRKAKGRI